MDVCNCHKFEVSEVKGDNEEWGCEIYYNCFLNGLEITNTSYILAHFI